jgi:phosphonopyruvate decarboxylase
MLNTQEFGGRLKQLGFDFYSGVPCSFLKSLINYAINECEYVMAANEGDAVAVAAGAWLGGRKSVVLMQNSGLTNATSPLTSLNFCFQIPVLGFVSLRGEPGLKDEPQHELMGQITGEMLTLMRVAWEYLSPEASEAEQQLLRADKAVRDGSTFFFVVRKGTFDDVALRGQAVSRPAQPVLDRNAGRYQRPARKAVLSSIARLAGEDTVLLATTGKTGRELFEVGDRPNQLYMVGSMGCVTSLALGLALVRPRTRVIALDGDGAALMRLGAMATLAYYAPPNLLHILLDNNSHDSTGGQATVSHIIDFAGLAHAMNYPRSGSSATLEELEAAISEWKDRGGLTFLHMAIDTAPTAEPVRPSVKPGEVKGRLIRFLGK